MTLSFSKRHGPLPVVPPVTERVADITDENLFPEIARAVAWVRKQREAGK